MGRGYKWYRIQLLKQDKRLQEHLPVTRVLTSDGLSAMLDRYPKVIVKPSDGSGGFGVIQISAAGNDKYRRQLNRGIAVYHGKKALTRSILRLTGKRPYIIQRRISLAENNHRPFDVRVMVQRRRGGEWKVTGILAKVAGPGYIITNLARSGGRVLPIKTAISLSHSPRSADSIVRELKEVALQSAYKLSSRYTKQRVFGMDMGIDHSGKVWIIESNFTPNISLFRHLSDKSMYRRILKYRGG